MSIVVVLLLLVAVIVGCGKGVDHRESQLSAPTLGEAWRTYEKYEKAEDEFAIALPVTWSPVTPDQLPYGTFDQLSRAIFATLNVSVGTLYVAARTGDLRSFIDTGRALRFYAADSAPRGSEGHSAVSVVKLPIEALKPPLDWFVTTHVATLRSWPSVMTPVSHRQVSLVAGEAEEFQYTMNVLMPLGRSEVVAVTDYFIFGKVYGFLVHLTVPVGQVERSRPVIEKIGQSFRGRTY